MEVTMSNETNITKPGVGEKTLRNLKGRAVVAPPVDIFENSEEYLLVVDLPGVNEKNVNVHVERGEMFIEGNRESEEQGTVLAREWRPLDYRRSFILPDSINTEAIVANLKAGVLHVRIPKASSARPRRIEVTAGA